MSDIISFLIELLAAGLMIVFGYTNFQKGAQLQKDAKTKEQQAKADKTKQLGQILMILGAAAFVLIALSQLVSFMAR